MVNKAIRNYAQLFFLSVAGSAIIEKPLNVATSTGGQTFFNCSSDTGALTWLYTANCNTAGGISLTDNNCDVVSNYASHYRTEHPDGFVCNLIVFDALLSLGGCYVCADGYGTGRQFQAMLLIIDSNANITSNSTDTVTGEDVMISNSISYRGPSIPSQQPPLPPSFYWTLQSDRNHNITSHQGLTTNTSASSYIVVTAQKPDVPPFMCNLFFNPPVVVPAGCASNAPIYSTSWATPTFPVSYPPENINISEITMSCPYNQPVFITCSASGYPIPTYTWFDLTHGGDSFFEGSTVKIDRGGTYQCVASNIIRDITYSESKSVDVSDCFTYVIDANQPISTCDPLCLAILVIATYFGSNLLFFALFIICYGCSKSDRSKMNGRFPWLTKMLPCMNDDGCRSSVWTLYFVLLSIFAAFIFFPIILIMASCCKKKKKFSQVIYDIDDNQPLTGVRTFQEVSIRKKLRQWDSRAAKSVLYYNLDNTESESSWRHRRGAGSTQLNTFTTTPTYPHPGRMSVTPNPPSPLNTSGHFPQDQLNRPYPHSSNQQRQPEFWGNSGPYPQNPRNLRPPPRPSPSPALSSGGIVYAELGVDNQAMSRRPIQPIQDKSNNCADIALA